MPRPSSTLFFSTLIIFASCYAALSILVFCSPYKAQMFSSAPCSWTRSGYVLFIYCAYKGCQPVYSFDYLFNRLTVRRDSAVGIATRYGLDGPGIESRWGAGFSAPVQTGPGAHPASCTMGTWSVPGVKRPGHGVDHPPHLVPRLKKE